MPLKTRAWQFTKLSFPLWDRSDESKPLISPGRLKEMTEGIRACLGYTGGSLDCPVFDMTNGVDAVYTFPSGIDEDARRKVLGILKMILPPHAPIRWSGTCIETSLRVAEWCETVGRADPHRTKE